MTNRNFKLYKSKIEYLVSPTPPKHPAITVFPSQSMKIAPIELLEQKKKKKKKEERKKKNHRIMSNISYSPISENPVVSTFKVYSESD